jgi:hypothetical protein
MHLQQARHADAPQTPKDTNISIVNEHEMDDYSVNTVETSVNEVCDDEPSNNRHNSTTDAHDLAAGDNGCK